jgi:hypothetical protein
MSWACEAASWMTVYGLMVCLPLFKSEASQAPTFVLSDIQTNPGTPSCIQW